MAKIYEDIRKAGGEVLVVSFASPEKVKTYLEKYPQPFPVVSDPDRAAYQGLGLGAASLGSMFRPGVIARYLKLIFRGWLPKKPDAEQDIYQLGGDFVIDAQGKLRYAHPSKLPTDRPAARELLEVLSPLPKGQGRNANADPKTEKFPAR